MHSKLQSFENLAALHWIFGAKNFPEMKLVFEPEHKLENKYRPLVLREPIRWSKDALQDAVKSLAALHWKFGAKNFTEMQLVFEPEHTLGNKYLSLRLTEPIRWSNDALQDAVLKNLAALHWMYEAKRFSMMQFEGIVMKPMFHFITYVYFLSSSMFTMINTTSNELSQFTKNYRYFIFSASLILRKHSPRIWLKLLSS